VFLQIIDDWRYIASVVDRLQLYIFLAITLGGTIRILANAPNIFEYVDQPAVIEKIRYANGHAEKFSWDAYTNSTG
jgi:nicotinic acetylcholine receptor